MLVWLSGIDNTSEAPNENYGRELMELFTLGARTSRLSVHGGRRSRAGAGADRLDAPTGTTTSATSNFRFDPELPRQRAEDDLRPERAASTGSDSCRLCLEHQAHADYFVGKLWSYFIPIPPSTQDARGRSSALPQARLRDPAGRRGDPRCTRVLYEGPSMVKPPVVSDRRACCGRAAQGVTPSDWSLDLRAAPASACSGPPNVSGWDEERWLDTSTFRGRWIAADRDRRRRRGVDPRRATPTTRRRRRPSTKALALLGRPDDRGGTQNELVALRAARSRPSIDGRLAGGAPTAPCARTPCGC